MSDAPTAEVLVRLLELEELDRDLFRGPNPEAASPGSRVFGGQVAGQSLRAAAHTVDPTHRPHSMHGYFMRPGEPGRPIIYHVDRIRDGRSFTTRRVRALQKGDAIFSMSASFHVDEEGAEHHVPIAVDVPSPDEEGGFLDTPVSRFARRSPFEVREIATPAPEGSSFPSTRRSWVRTRGPLPDDTVLHACVIAYLSDIGVVSASRAALGLEWEEIMGASLDHALWFHRPVRPDAWLLVDLRAVSNANARGLVLGTIHDTSGALGVTLAQEALVRRRRT